MKTIKSKLLSTTVVPACLSAGIVLGGGLAVAERSEAEAPGAVAAAEPSGALLPVAKPKPRGVQLAASCDPCAAKAPCNPCNPCAAAAGPCDPCAAGAAGAAASECAVPRLAAAANPCAAKKTGNPCNPCAAAPACNPCNPGAATAANPCNPCAAAKPCAAANPCNPCNPCGAAATDAALAPDEAAAAYDCIDGAMVDGYAKSGQDVAIAYQDWQRFNTSPYVSATHGNRYVNNYANDAAAHQYAKYEDLEGMPVGSVLAKDSFVVNGDGTVAAGPLFVMEKRESDFSPETGNWMYATILPNGDLMGVTGGQNSAGMKFCNDCHQAVAEGQDYLFLLPEDVRVR